MQICILEVPQNWHPPPCAAGPSYRTQRTSISVPSRPPPIEARRRRRRRWRSRRRPAAASEGSSWTSSRLDLERLRTRTLRTGLLALLEQGSLLGTKGIATNGARALLVTAVRHVHMRHVLRTWGGEDFCFIYLLGDQFQIFGILACMLKIMIHLESD